MALPEDRRSFPESSVSSIHLAESDQEIAACFPVMRELRAHLVEAEFVAMVRRQQSGGYRLAYLRHSEQVRAVAGLRLLENLVSGRLLYVDDLVTSSTERSKGYSKTLLDSGVQRFDAHRFYLTNRMIISAHHFVLKL
jgi:hypothetical protein